MLFADRPAVPEIAEARNVLEQGYSFEIQFGSRIEDSLDIFEIKQGDLALKDTVSAADYLAQLNALCREFGPLMQVRFYGHHSDVFDGAVLNHLPDVADLTLNCLDEAKNLDALGGLSLLENLALGIYELADKEVLSRVPLTKLTSLCLEESATKALDLAPLSEAKRLKTLKLYGHKKNIAAIGNIAGLEEFVFNPARNMDLDFINRLTRLKALKFVLGGIDDFNAVALPGLDQLAVTRVRGLTTLGDLSRFPQLRQLQVQDQKQISTIAFSAQSARLANISIDNCKSLKELSGLGRLPALKSLSVSRTALDIQELSLPKSLTHMSSFPGTTKGNKAAKDYIRSLGLIPEIHPDMPFFYK